MLWFFHHHTGKSHGAVQLACHLILALWTEPTASDHLTTHLTGNLDRRIICKLQSFLSDPLLDLCCIDIAILRYFFHCRTAMLLDITLYLLKLFLQCFFTRRTNNGPIYIIKTIYRICGQFFTIMTTSLFSAGYRQKIDVFNSFFLTKVRNRIYCTAGCINIIYYNNRI